jgi:subtilisin family serine protease
VTGKNVRVAVLDTGIDKTNTDFDGAIVAERNFISRDSEDVTDKNSHGTKMASIIGAREDDKNLLGVAQKSDLLIGKVANDEGYTKAKWLADGINWAVEKKADIINISLQLYRSSEELKNAINFATENNVIILASVGNPKYEGDIEQVFPAKYSGVISVAPATSDEMLRTPKPLSTEFEGKNPTVYAPGEHILADYFNNKLTDDYGASYATAVASGVAALSVQYYKEHGKTFNSEKIANEIKRLLNQPGMPIWAYMIIGFLALIIILGLCLVFIKKRWGRTSKPGKWGGLKLKNFRILDYIIVFILSYLFLMVAVMEVSAEAFAGAGIWALAISVVVGTVTNLVSLLVKYITRQE